MPQSNSLPGTFGDVHKMLTTDDAITGQQLANQASNAAGRAEAVSMDTEADPASPGQFGRVLAFSCPAMYDAVVAFSL